MTVSATTDSSSPITAASRIRPGQRSSELKYGLAIRQTVASVENIPRMEVSCLRELPVQVDE
jgi:hypothetical protein